MRQLQQLLDNVGISSTSDNFSSSGCLVLPQRNLQTSPGRRYTAYNKTQWLPYNKSIKFTYQNIVSKWTFAIGNTIVKLSKFAGRQAVHCSTAVYNFHGNGMPTSGVKVYVIDNSVLRKTINKLLSISTYLSTAWSRGGDRIPPEEELVLWLSGEFVMLAALSAWVYALVDGRNTAAVAGLALLTLPDLTNLFLFVGNGSIKAGLRWKIIAMKPLMFSCVEDQISRQVNDTTNYKYLVNTINICRVVKSVLVLKGLPFYKLFFKKNVVLHKMFY